MNRAYEMYNSFNDEENHVHVEIPYEHLDGEYGHMTRIAEHGVERVIHERGWRNGDAWQATARFIFDWGCGSIVEMLDGEVIRDER